MRTGEGGGGGGGATCRLGNAARIPFVRMAGLYIKLNSGVVVVDHVDTIKHHLMTTSLIRGI